MEAHWRVVAEGSLMEGPFSVVTDLLQLRPNKNVPAIKTNNFFIFRINYFFGCYIAININIFLSRQRINLLTCQAIYILMTAEIKIQPGILTLVLLITILFSCEKKAMPTISERKSPPPSKITTVYPPLATVAVDTAAGRQLFMARCNRCHVLPSAAQLTMARWDKVLPLMILRARLNNEQALHLRSWIMGNAAAQ
jgi:hypothetical protein